MYVMYIPGSFPRLMLLFSLSILVLQACIPLKPFIFTRTPPPPDYTKSRNWLCLPGKRDSADAVVPNSGMKNGQATAKVDVFFIHPTTYPQGTLWNADLKDTAFTKKTDRLVGRYQASVFNGDCRVYAPRYRTAVFFAYVHKTIDGVQAFEVAYSDVKCAFEYYLDHYNNGRPFIIASHSQGSDHAVRLLQEYIDRDSVLRKKMVAAYLPGALIYKETFKNLPVCDSSCQTGCFATWNSVRYGELTFYGRRTFNRFGRIICVNPLTWTQNTAEAPDSLNKGGVPFGYKTVDKHLASARISPVGLLWVHRPKHHTNKQYPQINSPSYHILDYNLFYMNIRENVHERISQYLLEHQK